MPSAMVIFALGNIHLNKKKSYHNVKIVEHWENMFALLQQIKKIYCKNTNICEKVLLDRSSSFIFLRTKLDFYEE
jgi:capsule polysaccharide export protein KpsC/LpsZ